MMMTMLQILLLVVVVVVVIVVTSSSSSSSSSTTIIDIITIITIGTTIIPSAGSRGRVSGPGPHELRPGRLAEYLEPAYIYIYIYIYIFVSPSGFALPLALHALRVRVSAILRHGSCALFQNVEGLRGDLRDFLGRRQKAATT